MVAPFSIEDRSKRGAISASSPHGTREAALFSWHQILETFARTFVLSVMNLFTHLKYAFRQMAKIQASLPIAVAGWPWELEPIPPSSVPSKPFSSNAALCPPDGCDCVEDAHSSFRVHTPAPGNYIEWRAQKPMFTDMAATRFTGAS